MQNRKDSLPRHTILAKQSSRLGAAIVDFALMFLGFLGLFYGCFNIIFFNSFTKDDMSKLATYEYHSHLVTLNEETNKSEIVKSTDDYKVYEKVVYYFYTSYLTGENIEIPEGGDASNPLQYAAPNYDRVINVSDEVKMTTKEYYSIAWYNENVLEINPSDYNENGLINEQNTAYFTYAKNADGSLDKSVLGVPREKRYNDSTSQMEDITATQLASFYTKKYQEAYYTLVDQPFYANVATHANLYSGISAVLPFVLSGAIFYVVIPLFTKDGKTLGKMIFKISLANYEGFKMKKYQLLLRFIPFFLTCASMLLVTSSIYICVIIIAVMFLTSFALMMASPKKCAMHDFVARTIVVDSKASHIFENPLEEENFCNKEDKIDEKIVYGGEEPELKYEK